VTVVSYTVAGMAVVPFTGTTPCGFMRPVRHSCDHEECPLGSSQVMAFDKDLSQAISACQLLWNMKDEQLLVRRFKVTAPTLCLASADLERGLWEGDEDAWANFHGLIEEHELCPAFHLTSIGALVTFAGSPGSIWKPQGRSMILPAGVEPVRPPVEDASWLQAQLDDPADLIDDALKGSEEPPEEPFGNGL
jgi:hypothetical protein